jgi:acyl carrier protein
MNKVENIASLLEEIISQGIEISAKDDKLQLATAKDYTIADYLIEKIKANKEEILRYLKKNNKENQTGPGCYPLSYHQLRLWMIDRIDQHTTAYNTHYSLILEDVDIDALKKALKSLINRHEILRTVFKVENEIPYQKIIQAEEADVRIEYYDLERDQNSEEKLNAMIQKSHNKKFELSSYPLFVTELFKLKQKQFVLNITLHHIITDAWSQQIFQRDLEAYYAFHKYNIKPDLPVLNKQYGDYAEQIRKIYDAESTVSNEDKRFWKNYLNDCFERINLTGDSQEGIDTGLVGKTLNIRFERPEAEVINRFCREHHLTPFMFFIGVLMVLLNKAQDKEKFLIGMSVSNRDDVDFENLIGFFINTVVIKNHAKEDISFREVSHDIRNAVLNILNHQNYPFDHLVAGLDIKRDFGRNPLFDVIISYHSVGEIPAVDAEAVTAGEITFTPKFDIDINITDFTEEIEVGMIYNSGIYSREMMKIFLEEYKSLALAMIAAPDSSLKTLNLKNDFRREVYPQKNIENKPAEIFSVPVNNEIHQDIKGKIQYLFTEILNIDHCQADDDFFSLGGHSLLGITLISRIRDEFNVDINYNTIFLYPTINALTNYILYIQSYVEDSVTGEYEDIDI